MACVAALSCATGHSAEAQSGVSEQETILASIALDPASMMSAGWESTLTVAQIATAFAMLDVAFEPNLILEGDGESSPLSLLLAYRSKMLIAHQCVAKVLTLEARLKTIEKPVMRGRDLKLAMEVVDRDVKIFEKEIFVLEQSIELADLDDEQEIRSGLRVRRGELASLKREREGLREILAVELSHALIEAEIKQLNAEIKSTRRDAQTLLTQLAGAPVDASTTSHVRMALGIPATMFSDN